MIATATLLMFSFRSWHISGFDISREFFLFKLTKLVSHWDIARFRDAYNACMSITILPTVLSHFTKLQDEYIYKLIFPVIFATVPVNIFFITKKFTNDVIALLAGLFFISHPWFVDPMVTLARQEIGFVFFTLLIFIIFSEDFSFKKKTIIYVIFAFSLVISHYSTAYIAIGILSLGFLGTMFFRAVVRLLQKTFVSTFIRKHKFDTWVREPIFINGWYVSILIFFTYIWLAQITGVSNNIEDFIQKSLRNIYSTSAQDSRSGIVNQVMNIDETNKLDTYSDYYQEKTEMYELRNDIYQYPPDKYKDFNMVPQTQRSLSISSPLLYKIVNTIYKGLIIGIQIFFLIGCLACFFFLRNRFKLDYIILLISCALILAAITFLPYVSQEYNFDRLYLQTMAVMSMFAIIGGISVLFSFSKFIGIRLFVIPILMIVLMYWYSFGFLWQLVGGKTVLWLNNFGYHYDVIYTHKGEIYAGLWLNQRNNKTLVYTHATGKNILSAYTNIFTFNSDVFPSTIDQNSYVYLTRANVQDRINYFFLKGVHLGYNYPYKFVEENKNKIYSNSSSEIYK